MIDATLATAEPKADSGPRFSDAYMLRYLLQQARSAQPIWVWLQDEDDGSYTATSGRMQLRMDVLHSRSGSRIVLSLGNGEDKVDIVEPRTVSFFGSKYATPEDAEVAQLLRALFTEVRTQAARNEQNLEKQLDDRKQNIYRQLLFGPIERP